VAKTDLTSWLLPNEGERLRDLVSSARESQEAAEVGRFHCRQHYEALTRFAKMAAHKLQVHRKNMAEQGLRCGGIKGIGWDQGRAKDL
jgi:hypothetical protein